MRNHERALVAFLHGTLDEGGEEAFDRHLLGCSECWEAMQQDRRGRRLLQALREVPPPELAERIGLAMATVTPAANPPKTSRLLPRTRRYGRANVARLAMVTTVLCVGAIATWLAPSSSPRLLNPIAATTSLARSLPDAGHPVSRPNSSSHLRQVGPMRAIPAAGQTLFATRYEMDGQAAVMVEANRPFVPPPGAHFHPALGMTWSVRIGAVNLLCPSGSPNVLLASRSGMATLSALAQRLGLTV